MRVTKRFHGEDMKMNITPMIDVVFQLLIFFIVVSEIASQDRIEDLTLPMASQAREEQVLPDRLIISIARRIVPGKGEEGRVDTIYIAGRAMTLQQMKDHLITEREYRRVPDGKETKQPLLIQADRYVQWRTVQDVLEGVSVPELKFWRVSFSVKIKQE